MSDKQLAIIRNVGIGCRDVGRPVLWFDVYISESSCSLQVFPWVQAEAIIEAYGVYDVKNLEGKPCWVISEGYSTSFVEACNIT